MHYFVRLVALQTMRSAGLPAWHQPLPFTYQSTGIETRFTNGLDPQPPSRPVFSFHRPETLADWLSIDSVQLDHAAPLAIAAWRIRSVPGWEFKTSRMDHY